MWTDNCQKAFDTLKQKLISSDVIAYPQEEGLFILDTDASDTQIAGVLSARWSWEIHQLWESNIKQG